MSWVMNTKHCIHEHVLSEFGDETLLLSSIKKTSHSSFRQCVFGEGLQSWGMSGGNCMLDLLLSSCPICAASELPRKRYWAARHIHCSCEFADCILSAMAVCWSSQRGRTSCLLSFLCLPCTSTGRIFLYIFSFLLWNWITVLMNCVQ